MKKLKAFGLTSMGFLFPPVCPLCGRALLPAEHGRCCGNCEGELKTVSPPVCFRCGRPVLNADAELCGNCRNRNFHFKKNYVVYPYEGEVRRLIADFKYREKKYIGEFFARETIKKFGEVLREKQFDAVIPIPIHKKRMKKRGYNQAEVYAGFIADEIGSPLNPYILVRSKETKAQKNLDTAGRMANLYDAFTADRAEIERAGKKRKDMKLKRVLLADDIFTTGSTLECASLKLLESGIEEVYCLCISGTREV